MLIIENTTEFALEHPSAVAIGKFDGLHVGHQKLIAEIVRAKAHNLKAVVFTFHPSPAVFFGKEPVAELMTREEKRVAFEQAGVDVLIEFPLNSQTASTSPEDFITEILVKQMRANLIVAGTDISYGDRGRGDYRLLQELLSDYHYEVVLIDKICQDNREISSSYVREEVQAGHMELVSTLLGRPYTITGAVVAGRQLGRHLGMPTVNLLAPKGKLLPPNGVYYSEVSYQGQTYRGITNIGYKPTVEDQKVLGIETYIYDFRDMIYGETITASLYGFKRPEMKFSGISELKEQLEADIHEGRHHETCRI